MDKKLEIESVRRFVSLENMEESIKTRQQVLEDLQLEADSKNEKIGSYKDQSRKTELDNVDLDYKTKKLARELDSLSEASSNLKRDNARMVAEVEERRREGDVVRSRKLQLFAQIDHAENLQKQVD